MAVAVCLLIFSNFSSKSVYAESDIEYLDNGCYIETTINVTRSTYASNTRSGSKTKTAKNASGAKLWSVTVHATFSYNPGVSATCTSCSGSSASYSSSWKVSEATCSKSGNSATATAKGTEYLNFLPIGSVTESVTLSCDSYGNLY